MIRTKTKKMNTRTVQIFITDKLKIGKNEDVYSGEP